MAVPPIQAAGLTSLGRVNRLSLVLDVIVGLVTAIAVPLAVVAIPNTISVVSALLPPEMAGVAILRAHGLALPVMLCTVPVASAVLKRFQAAPILLAGLALLAVADVLGGLAGSALAVGVLRALHGVGAGMLVPATFVACWERARAGRSVLVAIWAAALAGGLLGAQALALWPLAEVTSWRVTLQPYPMLTGVALALAAVQLVLSRMNGGSSGGEAVAHDRALVDDRALHAGHGPLDADDGVTNAPHGAPSTSADAGYVAGSADHTGWTGSAGADHMIGSPDRGVADAPADAGRMARGADHTAADAGPTVGGADHVAGAMAADADRMVGGADHTRADAGRTVGGADHAAGAMAADAGRTAAEAGHTVGGVDHKAADAGHTVVDAGYIVDQRVWTSGVGEGQAVAGAGGGVAGEWGGWRRLLLTAGPSAGLAVLAVGSTFDWPSGLIVTAAAAAVALLLAVASLSRADGPGGRVAALVMVAAGLVVLPTVAQVTYVELGGLGGPGLSGLWGPFGVAVVAGLGAALAAVRLDEAYVPRLVGAGLVVMVMGLCAVRLVVPAVSGGPLVVPFALLAAGASVALTAALRRVGLPGALYALCLCFPAVLSGFLVGTGIQVGWLRAVSMSGRVTSQAMVDGFVGALHIWALVAGFAVVVMLVLGAVLARRAPRRPSAGAVAEDVPAGDEKVDREGSSPVADFRTTMIPVVPLPTRSPEGGGEDGDGAEAR
ncbi:hypothetical protein [Sphaerisporangium fuscum]|uniref:hypothetical protein n=1 Tax=Sphaerisporangium fuscum TaxID=2835868 RepID=UPI001BDCC0EC|nr:hypothetical protein [Sphaerisporangium fuscum]